MATGSDASPETLDSLPPYPDFRFKLAWDQEGARAYVAGISTVSGFNRQTDVTAIREGGDPVTLHRLPGQASYEPITLERGVSYDPAFARWTKKAYDFPTGAGKPGQAALADFRKDLTLDIYNEAGEKVMAYTVFKAWVSEFQAVPELDANRQNALIIESIVLQNEGWEQVVSDNT